MADSIFATQTPTITNGNDATAYTLGTEFSRSTDGAITHGRWYFPNPAPTGTTDFVLYAGTGGAPLARASFVAPVAGAWNTVALSTPVAYTAGTVLVATVRTPGMYVATANFFTVDLVNGDIIAPAAANGRLDVADQFPGNVSGNHACFFADIVFAATGGVPDVVVNAMSASTVVALRASTSTAVAGRTSTPGVSSPAASTPTVSDG